MKKLIVYYSMEGNTQYIAEKMAERFGSDSDILRLVPKKAYLDKGFAKYVWGGRSAIVGEKPVLEPYSVDFSLIGILSKISGILAENKIGIFAVSTFNTDYILVKKENFDRAIDALAKADYIIED